MDAGDGPIGPAVEDSAYLDAAQCYKGKRRGLVRTCMRRLAGYARIRSVQIITANSAAPIRMAIEPTIVGSSGPFITVK